MWLLLLENLQNFDKTAPALTCIAFYVWKDYFISEISKIGDYWIIESLSTIRENERINDTVITDTELWDASARTTEIFDLTK